jgi:hypothetical protein
MSSMMSVNPNAQRSLARGAGKESTRELLDDDRAHRTPRMRELVGFYLRVMESVEQGDNRQGFLGAVQLVIPERFTGARLRFVEEMGLSGDAAVAMNALGQLRIAAVETDVEAELLDRVAALVGAAGDADHARALELGDLPDRRADRAG